MVSSPVQHTHFLHVAYGVEKREKENTQPGGKTYKHVASLVAGERKNQEFLGHATFCS